MKLTIELVPETSWYKNLRNSVSREEWDRIRKDCYRKAGNRCEICGKTGKLNCHEIWEFDDSRSIQKLNSFIALCDLCHNIKHMGFVNVQISRGIWPESYREELARHFMKVNCVPRKDFDRCVDEAFALWEKRSSKKWRLDMGTHATAHKPGQMKLNEAFYSRESKKKS